ncbi:hypothetical protein MSG28_016228 [Choristoneura fumiferana]|uniref:Uncharacterized protein n=1 Tax=Choristoneura fumiferana TaxID=7141 RepID=A0ACC0K701_CHOFU|nr:hypothetical protein MSG28_016228 [Choristoneura fumiferana]
MRLDRVCCVRNCGKTREDNIILHKFPNPEKDPNRFRSWTFAIGGNILVLDDMYIYNHRRVCNQHFEPAFRTRSKGLSNIAVPTLHLTDQGVLSQECKHTAELILFIDNLFDSMNGSYKNSTNRSGKPLLQALKPNSPHKDIEAHVSKMNNGDCFILDKDHNIFVFVGQKAKGVEKMKAISVANQIRDQDHNGRAEIEIIGMINLSNALGSGDMDSVPSDEEGGDDEVHVSKIPEGVEPTSFKRNNLSWDIHYWIGSASTQDEAGAAAILTVGLDDKFGGAAIQHRETLGHESPQFLGYFRPDKDHDIYVYVGARAKNVEKLKAISVANQIRDQDHNGRGRAFERSEEQTVTLSEISDSTGGSIYVWVGKQSTEREKTEAMSKAQQYLSAKNYPSWVHVSRIPQGTEPAAFKQYFSTWRDVGMSHSRIVRSLSDQGDGTYVVYRIENLDMVKAYDSSAPGTEAGKRFGELYQGDSYVMKYKYDADGISNYVVYYWLIYGTKAGEDMRAEQVPEVTTSLNPDDVFLLETPNKVYTSSQVEKDEAVHFVHRILGADRQFQVITQGSEPDDFFSYLNGDASQISSTESWRELVTRRLGTEARLFDADIFGDNTVSFEEIFNIKQSELHSDDAYVLDTGDELYVWIGKDTTNHKKRVPEDDDIRTNEILA